MTRSRRDFLKLSAIAGGSVLLPGASAFSSDRTPFSFAPHTGKAPKPLRLLILGGTGFTGPFQVKYALSRGHKVTVFNRGKTHPGELPKEAEQLIGDRNGQLHREIRSLFEGRQPLITCFLHYTIDPDKLPEFEHYARVWMR